MAVESAFPRARIIPSEDVIGRRGFLDQLAERLYYGDSVMLAGPRRIGKTSAAYEVLRMLERRECYTLRVDLLHVVSIENFALQVLKQASTLRSSIVQATLHSIKEFQGWFQKTEWSVEISDIKWGAKFSSNESIDPLMALEEAFELVERMAKKDGKRLVFLLDEFQEVDRIGGEALLNALRTVFQQQENTTYLFLGSEPSMMRTIFADRRRAIYSFATILHLPEITEEEWREYANRKLKHLGMSIEDSALQVILNGAGRHPHGVMATLLNAFFEAKQEGKTQIVASHAYAALEQTFEQFDAIYEELWKRILEIAKADEVLIALASGTPPYRGNPATPVRRAIDGLIKNSIISRPTRGRYQFVESMFQHWIVEKNGGQRGFWF